VILAIAKALGDQLGASQDLTLTRSGAMVGSSEYLAPELIMGQPYDGRVDQYALGIVIYELLMGECPFAGPNPTAIAVQHATADPPNIHDKVGSITEAASSAVRRAMSKSPDERYSRCEALVREIVKGARQAKAEVPGTSKSPTRVPAKQASETKTREKPESEPPQRVIQTGDIVTNSIAMQLVLIPHGGFMMGAPPTDDGWVGDDRQHPVRITKPFYLAVHEVTQEQYERVMGKTPSRFRGGQYPVEKVSWDDSVEFCRRLSELPEELVAGHVYRLPSEAEWEYACRAGTTTAYSFGDDASQLGKYAWFDGNSGKRTHAVGQKQPNTWGLYDMHGNVWK